jgi:hypothetical protein
VGSDRHDSRGPFRVASVRFVFGRSQVRTGYGLSLLTNVISRTPYRGQSFKLRLRTLDKLSSLSQEGVQMASLAADDLSRIISLRRLGTSCCFFSPRFGHAMWAHIKHAPFFLPLFILPPMIVSQLGSRGRFSLLPSWHGEGRSLACHPSPSLSSSRSFT